jgi:2-polyprenyl-3-methyl-5-hydroxy-6-metoxy-1,4-benzoquinol methylase
VNPAPNAGELNKFYENYYQIHGDLSKSSVAKYTYETKLLSPLSDIRIKRLENLYSPLKHKGWALDIGCGRGQFLYLLKKLGYLVEGVEPDISSQKYAKDLGINSIFSGYIEQFQSDKKYQLITMLDVIEHPLGPMHLLGLVEKMLAPGGFLLIWTPNGNSNHELEKMTFRVDLEHMQYLTEKSCQYIANTLQLNIAHFETLGIHGSFEKLNHLQILDKKSNNKKKIKLKIKKMITSLPGWYSIIAPIIYNNTAEDINISQINKNYHLLCIFQKPANKSIQYDHNRQSRKATLQ